VQFLGAAPAKEAAEAPEEALPEPSTETTWLEESEGQANES
jgi:hypothetical protein